VQRGSERFFEDPQVTDDLGLAVRIETGEQRIALGVGVLPQTDQRIAARPGELPTPWCFSRAASFPFAAKIGGAC
jgi:hypothetical protein